MRSSQWRVEGKTFVLICGLPSQSLSSTPEIVGRGLERERIAGADCASGLGRGVGEGKQKSTLFPNIVKDMVPVGTSKIAAAVVRNGQPKMRGDREVHIRVKGQRSHTG